MNLSLQETQAVGRLAQHLYDYLPGKPHPYADQSLSFQGVAQTCGIGSFWPGGSKLPAITKLLENTLVHQRQDFCTLMTEIVRRGMAYRQNKGNHVTREEIRALNQLITNVGFKIPELWDPSFLDSLPRAEPDYEESAPEGPSKEDLAKLATKLIDIGKLQGAKRGYAFERLLQDLFSAFCLQPRQSFRLTGEQIDGSFVLDSETYLVEAKWHSKLIGQDELLVFSGKVGGKAKWSRGLFISFTGFSSEGLHEFSKKGATGIIGMTGQDLWFVLDGPVPLTEAIRKKVRIAAETGEFYIPLFQLFPGGKSKEYRKHPHALVSGAFDRLKLRSAFR